jgi:hypothetical protein
MLRLELFTPGNPILIDCQIGIRYLRHYIGLCNSYASSSLRKILCLASGNRDCNLL